MVPFPIPGGTDGPVDICKQCNLAQVTNVAGNIIDVDQKIVVDLVLNLGGHQTKLAEQEIVRH